MRRRRAVAVILLALAPVLYSYGTTMLQPSSVGLGVRSVEWVRAHHGAWLVNEAEKLYYSWTAPAKGGSALRTLPHVGAGASRPATNEPPRVTPLIRPRLAGEGVWHTTGPQVAGGPPVLVTTFRPQRDYPRIVAYVAWFDHTRTQLALYPGRYEPPGAQPRGPMEVPPRERRSLLATFNSGFKFSDAHGGFFVNGHTTTPLRRGQGTILAYRDGRVDIIDWRGGPIPGHNVVLARQNLPLIVDRHRPSPLLADNGLWGNTLGNAIRVWRSGVGIDRHGDLIYAAADYQTAASLAAILIHVGAVRAIELDINAEWPSLITYGHAGSANPDKIVPNTQQPATRYLVPDDRDFFAIYRPLKNRGRVLFR